MRRTLILLAPALIGIISAGVAGGAEPAGALQENRVALEEYALAKSPDFYFMMDLGARTIDLKARGLVLQAMGAVASPVLGDTGPVQGPLAGAKNCPRAAEAAGHQTGGAGDGIDEAGEFELEALEVKDMPPAYTLELEDGTKISVVTKAKGLFAIWRGVKWYVGLPLETLRLKLHKRTMTVIEISFEDPKEGQSLYWALMEGLNGFVWVPRSE